MQTTAVDAPGKETYNYLFRTNAQVRRRIERVAEQYDMSFKNALSLLIHEALEARGIPKE